MKILLNIAVIYFRSAGQTIGDSNHSVEELKELMLDTMYT